MDFIYRSDCSQTQFATAYYSILFPDLLSKMFNRLRIVNIYSKKKHVRIINIVRIVILKCLFANVFTIKSKYMFSVAFLKSNRFEYTIYFVID